MNETILGGQADVAIGNFLIPARFLGDISPDFKEGTRETTTLGGKRTQPSGIMDTAELTFMLYLPSKDYLKHIWADIYNAPSGDQLTGNFNLGAGTCTTRTPVPVNIHYTCEDNDDNDDHIYSALVAFNYNPTLNDSDGLAVEVTVYAQPTENGYIRIGTGDLTQESIYDTATQATVPTES